MQTHLLRRKKLIDKNIIDPNEELKLLDLIFTFPKHTKYSIIWHHRYFCLLQNLSNDNDNNNGNNQ